MAEQLCEECGFLYTESDVEKCYKLNKEVVGVSECATFITRQFEDGEPLTPREHEWFLKNDKDRKKLTVGIQGLRL